MLGHFEGETRRGFRKGEIGDNGTHGRPHSRPDRVVFLYRGSLLTSSSNKTVGSTES